MRLTSTIRRPCPGTEPGIALIIVMISIFVLTVLAGGFAYSMKVETRLARNANSETELEWLGRSAVECARWELAEQLRITQERWDSLDQVWAGGPGGMFTSNSPLADFKAEIQSLNGSATWKIVDCERKYNINFANEQTLEQALTVMGVDAGETTPVVGAMLDWMDPDDVTHTQGAESDYYQSLDPPYRSVFVLRDIDELSTEDTADALGLSIPAVKSRLLRARLQLREKLTRHFKRKGDDAFAYL